LFEYPEAYMLKVLGLMVVGILLAAYGLYLVSTGLPIIQLPNVNWGMVGFVLIIGSAASFGTAFVASRFK
jgi:hypothetical protein